MSIPVSEQDIAVLEKVDAPTLFKPNGGDVLLNIIESNARAMVNGATADTSEDREILRSTAYKIAKMKKRIDEVKTNYVRDIKALPMQIDAEGRRIRERLEQLHDEIRGPLTDWENAEKARQDAHKAKIEELSIESYRSNSQGYDSEALKGVLKSFQSLYADFDFEEFQSQANKARAATLSQIQSDINEKIAAEDAERQRIEAERIAQKAREAQLIKDAEERTRREEQEKHDEEIRQIQYAEERKRVEAIQAERERIAKEEAGTGAEHGEIISAAYRYIHPVEIQNVHHNDPFPASPTAVIRTPVAAPACVAVSATDKKQINRDIRDAFIGVFQNLTGTPEDYGKIAALAIISGNIPHVTISYLAE